MKEQQEWLCPLAAEKIPANFEWVAQDQNGYWFAYEVKPKLPRSRIYVFNGWRLINENWF